MRKKKSIKLLGIIIALFLIVICVQFICFYRILQLSAAGHPENQRADVIAVFRGAEGRVKKGFELANRGVAPFLIISPSSKTNLVTLDRMFRQSQQFNYLLEPRADTTYQNALFVSRLVPDHRKQTVALVTSDYHMPRSYILFALERLGTETTILPCPANGGRFSANPLAWSTRQKKQVYNEMVEFWGSIIEMARHFIYGDVPKRSLKRNAAVTFLREVLLFEL